MPKYSVTLEETVLYEVEIEADDEETAKEIAADLWCQSEDPFNDFCGHGSGVKAINVDDITHQMAGT